MICSFFFDWFIAVNYTCQGMIATEDIKELTYLGELGQHCWNVSVNYT